MRVYKYPLSPFVDQTISMPHGARVVHLAVQDGQVCLWAIVDPSAPPEPRHFSVLGTGDRTLAEDSTYVGTVLLDGGFDVLHVFEEAR